MLTPVFSIEQEADYLIFTIRAPYAKIAETEIEYAEELFIFCSKPYYLRVHLPCPVHDDDTGSANYDSEDGTFTVRVPKLNKGEHFPRLDMITELLRPQKAAPSANRLVEEIVGGSDGEEDYDGEEDGNGDEYHTEQTPTLIVESITDGGRLGYGFGWRRAGILGKLSTEIGKLVELPDPEESEVSSRAELCRQHDIEEFNPEHYLGDTLEADDELKRLISLTFPTEMGLSQENIERLKDLPAKKLPSLSADEQYKISLSLLDILYAYCYDLRTNDWEHSVESGWTIANLSPTISWLVRWESAKEALSSAVRRALTKPLYRNWNLILAVLDDTKQLLKLGRTAIVHALCDIHSLMVSSGEFRYLFNDLLLTELLLWAQSADDEVFERLTKEAQEVTISKEATSLDLDEWEMEARMHQLNLDNPENKEKEGLDSDDCESEDEN